MPASLVKKRKAPAKSASKFTDSTFIKNIILPMGEKTVLEPEDDSEFFSLFFLSFISRISRTN